MLWMIYVISICLGTSISIHVKYDDTWWIYMIYDDSEKKGHWLTALVPAYLYAGQLYMTIMHVLNLRVSVQPSGSSLAYGLLFYLRVLVIQVQRMCLSLYCVYHNSECYYVISVEAWNLICTWTLICTWILKCIWILICIWALICSLTCT